MKESAAMQLCLITVGKLKEPGFRALRDEYVKRLSRFCRLEEVELPDLPEPAAPSEALEKQVMQREGEAILQRIKPGDYVVAMTIPGKQWDSAALSRHLSDLKCRGVGRMVFVIGGSLGLSDEVKHRADEELSMSKMTFPHQLARVMLLEQLYRCMKIEAGERYHK